MKIFISIASFCDPILQFTITRAVKMAKYPSRLTFGVVDQSFAGDKTITSSDAYPAKLKRLWINPIQSRGCSWARANAQSMYSDEDWFFQIDSHMEFAKDWDETLVNWGQKLIEQRHKNFVITSYPVGFTFGSDETIQYQPYPKNNVLCQVVKPTCKFGKDHFLTFEGHPFINDKPVMGFGLAAGCLFAPGSFVYKFPYDPFVYFLGEEQMLAARLFTNGWDIFHIPDLPIWHLYEDRILNSNEKKRQYHWSKELENKRSESWQSRNAEAIKRMSNMLTGQDLGVYGLGHKRTMLEFAELSGIDYQGKRLASTAFKGKWQESQ